MPFIQQGMLVRGTCQPVCVRKSCSGSREWMISPSERVINNSSSEPSNMVAPMPNRAEDSLILNRSPACFHSFITAESDWSGERTPIFPYTDQFSSWCNRFILSFQSSGWTSVDGVVISGLVEHALRRVVSTAARNRKVEQEAEQEFEQQGKAMAGLFLPGGCVIGGCVSITLVKRDGELFKGLIQYDVVIILFKGFFPYCQGSLFLSGYP